ncbi:MAG: hypothetical protein PVJ61_03785 [Dehalococcoidia bacterium]|jgi:hypothetical protein
MENAIVSLLCIALFLTGTLNLAETSLSVVDKISSSWRQAEEQSYEIRQTGIATVNATVPDASHVEITIINEGAVSLGDFDRWDVIIRYQDGTAVWLPYNSVPGWTVDSISFEGSPETFDPDILNAGEEMLLVLRLDPPLPSESTAEAAISTPRGIVARAMFAME